jgi:hypothetical protein
MGKIIEYEKGQRLGELIYLEEVELYISPSGYKSRKALFKCRCRKEFTTVIQKVKAGNTKSCGCFKIERDRKRNTTHGLTHDPLFSVWQGIKTRCCNNNNKDFDRYIGRGIKVCDEWKNNFVAFYDWAMQNGYEKSLQIDRKENNLGYSPNNCRFVTPAVNIRNSTVAKLTETNVRKIKIILRDFPDIKYKDISEEFNVTVGTIYAIIKGRTWKDVSI